jgi:hypothetical protein
MRKAGQLDDAEHITNPALQAFRPVTRDLASTLSEKTRGIEKKLKYVDRKPFRKTVFEIAQENIKDPLTRVDRTAHLVTSNVTSQIISGARAAMATAAIQRPPQQYRPHTPAATGQWDDREGRNLRNNLQRLGSGPAPEPTPREPIPMVAESTPTPSAGPMADAIASRNPNRRLRAAKALGANSGQGGSRAGRPDGSKKSLIGKKKVTGPFPFKKPPPEPPKIIGHSVFGPVYEGSTMGVKAEASEAVVKEETLKAGVLMDGRVQVSSAEAMEEDEVDGVFVRDPPTPNDTIPGTSKAHAGKPEEIKTVPTGTEVKTEPKGRRPPLTPIESPDDRGPDRDVEITGEIGTEERLRRNLESAKAIGKYEDLTLGKAEKASKKATRNRPGPYSRITSHGPIVRAAQGALILSEISTMVSAGIQEERDKRPLLPPSDDGTIVVAAADSSGNQGVIVSRPESALAVPGMVNARPNPALDTNVIDEVITDAALSSKGDSRRTPAFLPTKQEQLAQEGTVRRAITYAKTSNFSRALKAAHARGTSGVNPLAETRLAIAPHETSLTTVPETSLAIVPETRLATVPGSAETEAGTETDASATLVAGANPDQDLTNYEFTVDDIAEVLAILGNMVGEDNVEDVTQVFRTHGSRKLIDSVNGLFATPAGRREAVTKIILTNLIHSVLNEATGVGERIGIHHRDGWVDTMIGAYLTSAASEGQTQYKVAAENVARWGINLSTVNENIMYNADGYVGDPNHRDAMIEARGDLMIYNRLSDSEFQATFNYETPQDSRARMANQVNNETGWFEAMDAIADDTPLSTGRPPPRTNDPVKSEVLGYSHQFARPWN